MFAPDLCPAPISGNFLCLWHFLTPGVAPLKLRLIARIAEHPSRPIFPPPWDVTGAFRLCDFIGVWKPSTATGTYSVPTVGACKCTPSGASAPRFGLFPCLLPPPDVV